MNPRDLKPSDRVSWAAGTLDASRGNPHVAEVLPVLHDTARELAAAEKSLNRRALPAALIGLIIGALLAYWYFSPGRYVVVNSNPPLRVDHWTGKTWEKQPYGGWRELK